MQIEKTQQDTIAVAIRDGLVKKARENVAPGNTIHVPPLDWTPKDGPEGLVTAKVERVVEGAAILRDSDNMPWAVWL